MSYVVSTASKSPFVKPKKHSQRESFRPVVQLLFPFDNSLFSHGEIHSASLRVSSMAGSIPVPHLQSPPFRIPLAESRVLSPAPRAPREASGIPDPLAESRVKAPAPRAIWGATEIPDSFSRIPGAVPRPQRACSQTNIQPRLLFKSL